MIKQVPVQVETFGFRDGFFLSIYFRESIGSVKRGNRRILENQEPVVKQKDVCPFFMMIILMGMPPGDGGFEMVTGDPAIFAGLYKKIISAIDQLPVPAGAVLLLIQDQVAGSVCPRVEPGGLKAHEGQ